MAGLSDLLNSDLGKQLISGASAQTGASESKTADVLSMAMPVLLGASPEGASGLMGALSGKHDGGILDNLGNLLGGGSVDQSVMSDGAGILSHVLGGKQPVVENTLSQKTGLDAGTIAQILKIAAPVLLGIIGKQTKENGINDSDGLTGILGSMLGGQPKENQSLIASLIDADGDGSVLDDVADMVLGSNKQKGGLGGMLDGLFGK